MAEQKPKSTVNIKPIKAVSMEKAKDYLDRHEKAGTPYGRAKGVKTKLTIEELRIAITAKIPAAELLKKHGISKEELQSLVFKLSKSELRDTPIKYS